MSLFGRVGYFDEAPRQRQGVDHQRRSGRQRHHVTKHVSGGVRAGVAGPAASCRPASSRLRDVPQQLPRRSRPRRRAHRADDAQSARARRRASAPRWPVVAGVRRTNTTFPPAPTGAGWTATATRTRWMLLRGDDRDAAARSRAARSRASARSCRTSSRRSHDLSVTVSARVDHWSNYDGHNLETTVATGQPTAGNVPDLPDRSDTVVSPSVAASYRVTDQGDAPGAT